MTKFFTRKFRLLLAGSVALFAFSAVCFLSCKKSIDPEGQHITGIFSGENCYSSPAPNVTVNQGSDNSTILIPSTIGVGTCAKIVNVAGSVSSGYIQFNSQNFTDGCGNAVVITGSGNITGHELFYDLNLVYTIAGKQVPASICFAGKK